MAEFVHPLEADEFEDLLTLYLCSYDNRGARAGSDERRRVHGLIVEYIERHYVPFEEITRLQADYLVMANSRTEAGHQLTIALADKERRDELIESGAGARQDARGWFVEWPDGAETTGRWPTACEAFDATDAAITAMKEGESDG